MTRSLRIALTWIAGIGLSYCGGRAQLEDRAPDSPVPVEAGADDAGEDAGTDGDGANDAVVPDGVADLGDADKPCVEDDDCVGHQQCHAGTCCNGDFDSATGTCTCGAGPGCLPYQLCCDHNNQPNITEDKCTYKANDCTEW